MSQIENLLYEAHSLGIREEVIEKVREHQIECNSKGIFFKQLDSYEEVMKKKREHKDSKKIGKNVREAFRAEKTGVREGGRGKGKPFPEGRKEGCRE